MPPAAADTQRKSLTRHRSKPKTTSIPPSCPSGVSDDAACHPSISDLDLREQEAKSHRSITCKRDADYHGQDQSNTSAGESGKRKQTPRKKQGSLPNGSSPMPKLNNTPRSIQRTISLTPGKKSTTPSQAYAGPTFHASPAASSLPIPRFFSKSVPELNKGPSLQESMEKETTEESSEQSEGSPTPAFRQRIGEEQVREESPLDIFFKADREQKERLRQESLGAQNNPSGRAGFGRPRHHSRNSTNGSMGAVFPLELEDKEPVQGSHEKSYSEPSTGAVDVDRPKSCSPSVGTMETPQQAEQRKAKTIALKKLLLSSVPPSADDMPESRQSTRSSSTPDHGPSPHKPKRSTSPQIYKQLAAQSAGQKSPCPRPSSNLRKEMSASALPETGQMPELPATPTPSRTRNAYRSAPLDGAGTPSVDGESYVSPGSTSSKRSITASTTAANSSPYKSMEDDLRRILKLDDLPSNSATG
ncbi:MAG: hypothetical protein L6R39_006948, partial [Caloplaca ligustica]